MSIDIDWSLLTPSSLSTNLVDLLNTHLASASRPSFIGPITVTSFDFGTEAPDVEIKDIRDVWRAFDEGDEEGDDELALATSTSPPRLRKMDGSNGGMSEYDMVDRAEGNDDLDDMASIYSGIGSPRSVVAVGIGLNSGILRDHHTILPFSTSILGRQKGSRPGSVFSMPMNNNSNNNNNYPKHTNDIPLDSPPPSPPVKPINTPESKSTIPSLQLHFKISYMSNLHITLLTSLNVNYPSDNFMSLPLKLSITGMTLGGDVVVAYSGDKHRIHLCLIDDDEINQNQNLPIGQKILPSLSMESEIGHSDAHVLKNVGKVERFIADVVRKTLVEELVFPNFLTLAL